MIFRNNLSADRKQQKEDNINNFLQADDWRSTTVSAHSGRVRAKSVKYQSTSRLCNRVRLGPSVLTISCTIKQVILSLCYLMRITFF